jgi:sulfur carrier protein
LPRVWINDGIAAFRAARNAAGRPSCSSSLVQSSDIQKVITVSINGTTRQLPDSAGVAALLEEMDLTGKRIALERNGEIVPRSMFATQKLADGDKLEIVVAVGGG